MCGRPDEWTAAAAAAIHRADVNETLTQISLYLRAGFFFFFFFLFATKTPGQEKKSYQEQAEMRASFPSHSSVFGAREGKAAYWFSRERCSF